MDAAAIHLKFHVFGFRILQVVPPHVQGNAIPPNQLLILTVFINWLDASSLVARYRCCHVTSLNRIVFVVMLLSTLETRGFLPIRADHSNAKYRLRNSGPPLRPAADCG
jgi:hypothetical protein